LLARTLEVCFNVHLPARLLSRCRTFALGALAGRCTISLGALEVRCTFSLGALAGHRGFPLGALEVRRRAFALRSAGLSVARRRPTRQ
jgi:hypothetical protein